MFKSILKVTHKFELIGKLTKVCLIPNTGDVHKHKRPTVGIGLRIYVSERKEERKEKRT